MSTTKRRCSSTRTGSHRTKKSQPQKAPERSDDNPFQMLQENKTARLLTKDQIASGAMSSEDLEQILEEAVRTHSAETVSLVGRMMLEDFQQEMKAFSLFDWQPERMNHLTEPLQIYLGIQHILRSTKDLPKVDSMNAAEMEHNSLQGNFFWLSCYGQGGKNYFRSIVPTLDNSSSAAWHSHRQQMRDYSDRFQNRLRFLFTFFLNCPDAPTRSCSLGWIAQVANKNKARTQLVYQEIGVVPPYQGWEATNPGPDSPETLVPLRADRRTLGSDQQAREMLGKLSSPAMLVSLCRMLTQMILAIRRSGKQEGSFDLFSALLMPNMVDTSQETRWGVNRTELQAIQIQKRQNFASSCQEDRDSATRGLLLFYTLKHLEVGLLPELAKLKQIQDSVRQSPQSTELLAAMFIREAQLLDPTFVNEVVELCVFILKIFVHGLRHHPEQVVVFPESFLTTIINCFTEITCLVPQHRFFVGQQDDLVSVCSSLLQLLVADQSIRSLRLRSSIITLLHRWLHVQSPIRPVDGVAFFDHPSLLEHFPKLLQFAAQNAAAVTATEAQPSVENIFVRKMIVYLGRSKVPLEKMLAVPQYQDLFSSWCTEVLSYIGAALQSIKTLRQLETGPDFEPLHPHYARLVSRAQKFVADFFCMLLLLTNISEQQASFFTPIIGDVSNLIQYVLAFIVEHPLPLNLICAEQIQFLPSAVLECICRLSLQLSGPHFNFALASEDSFVKEVLPRLVPLLRQYYIHGDMIAAFEKLCHSVRQISHLLKEADPPDEFYDPLVNTIMKDPVILPTSQVIIDRNTILRLLKVSPLDPYTRTPLSAEQLEPASALKSQLDQFWTRLLVL